MLNTHCNKEEDEVEELADAPSSNKSVLWTYFFPIGFPFKRRENGEKTEDKTTTMCKICRYSLPYILWQRRSEVYALL